LPVFERLGDVREVAITQGQVARIVAARGEVDEALRICRELQLLVFMRLGDKRRIAFTQGQIADLLAGRAGPGDLGEALRIRQDEELPAFERLGNARLVAATLSKIASKQFELAKIDVANGDMDSATARINESLSIYFKKGEVDGILEVTKYYGKELAPANVKAQSTAVLDPAFDAYAVSIATTFSSSSN
jgi:hypothetical protein